MSAPDDIDVEGLSIVLSHGVLRTTLYVDLRHWATPWELWSRFMHDWRSIARNSVTPDWALMRPARQQPPQQRSRQYYQSLLDDSRFAGASNAILPRHDAQQRRFAISITPFISISTDVDVNYRPTKYSIYSQIIKPLT